MSSKKKTIEISQEVWTYLEQLTALEGCTPEEYLEFLVEKQFLKVRKGMKTPVKLPGIAPPVPSDDLPTKPQTPSSMTMEAVKEEIKKE